jgi:hypothetical protein
MSALEQRLQALGRELEYPPGPDVTGAVLGRLDRRPFPWRPVALALAVAVLALAIGAAFAVPQARSAILRFFHLRGATVERVETLPPAVERSQAGGLGRPLSEDESERVVGFRIVLPPLRGEPRRVYVLGDSLASVILRSHGHTVLLSEFRASGFDLLKKAAADATLVEPVQVDGAEGLWIEGAPHTLTYVDRSGRFRERTVRIRGNVLLWNRGPLTLRLEGRLTKAQALQLVHQIR